MLQNDFFLPRYCWFLNCLDQHEISLPYEIDARPDTLLIDFLTGIRKLFSSYSDINFPELCQQV